MNEPGNLRRGPTEEIQWEWPLWERIAARPEARQPFRKLAEDLTLACQKMLRESGRADDSESAFADEAHRIVGTEDLRDVLLATMNLSLRFSGITREPGS